MVTLNRRLRQARELRGWSQAKVAEQVGTDATTVSRWERGLFFPTPYFRERLCSLFGKNAEELGLIETASQDQEIAPGAEMFYTAGTFSQAPPSWPKRTDTFKYILQSAAYDELAHTLWKDAYVRVLQGQYTQAQELGEASLNAFEQVGHTNAAAIREWLDQRGLTSLPPTTLLPPTHISHVEKPVHISNRPIHRKKVGFFLTLLLLFFVGSLFAEVSLGPLHPTASLQPLLSVEKAYDHPATFPDLNVHVVPPVRPVLTPVAALPSTSTGVTSSVTRSVPAASPTPDPTAMVVASVPSPSTSTAADTSPRVTMRVSPARLTAQVCSLESLGYRCTVVLWLFSVDQVTFSWQASSEKIAARFSPASGTGTTNQPTQLTVYIQATSADTGLLIFSFSVFSSLYTSNVAWN